MKFHFGGQNWETPIECPRVQLPSTYDRNNLIIGLLPKKVQKVDHGASPILSSMNRVDIVYHSITEISVVNAKCAQLLPGQIGPSARCPRYDCLVWRLDDHP